LYSGTGGGAEQLDEPPAKQLDRCELLVQHINNSKKEILELEKAKEVAEKANDFDLEIQLDENIDSYHKKN